MSICYNKSRKKYFICYDLKLPDGSFKTISIYNKEWTKERGKKYIQLIEAEEIEKDKRKRTLFLHTKNSITLNELSELFITECKSMLKFQTVYNKNLIIKKYILSNFLSTASLENAFTIKTIENFKTKIIDIKTIDSKRKNRIFLLLKNMLEYAADHEYISYELFRKLKVLLKPIRESLSPNKEALSFWTNEEWDKFYDTFKEDDIWRLLFKTTYVCGLRIGELIPLKWSDFNPIAKTISINKSMDSSGNLDDAKTASSHGNVSLTNDLVEELKNLKEILYCTDDDYMFFGPKHTSRTTIRRIMDEHAKKANIPHIKFHGLRHSCASRMINAGISPLIVSKHLRHSSVKETLDTYSHIFPSETIGIMDKVF